MEVLISQSQLCNVTVAMRLWFWFIGDRDCIAFFMNECMCVFFITQVPNETSEWHVLNLVY